MLTNCTASIILFLLDCSTKPHVLSKGGAENCLGLSYNKARFGPHQDTNEVVTLSTFLRLSEYTMTGPLMNLLRALSTLLPPGYHALARSVLLFFSDLSFNTKLFNGHQYTSPNKLKNERVLSMKCSQMEIIQLY